MHTSIESTPPVAPAQIPEYVNDLPNLCGCESQVAAVVDGTRASPVYLGRTPVRIENVQSAVAIALHMHQPLIPAGRQLPAGTGAFAGLSATAGDGLTAAEIISNLRWMLEHPEVHDNHNATAFRWCYRRIGEFIPQLLAEGHQPRVMLEYSGTLLHGLRQMGADEVIEALRPITCDPGLRDAVEWLGCPWGHAVAPSTPVQDYRLHVRAWQQHFAAIFGWEALGRVRGFSPSEMALPNHPDVGYEFVRTLVDCGYQWVIVQEHTVELPDGRPLERRHLPHRLVCTNSRGETAEIVAVIKTQGSDTKLVAQMQPYYEARGLGREALAGHEVPPLVSQIADGENGGVMMNEFPAKYFEVVRECSGGGTPMMNVTEYLEQVFALGVRPGDLPAIQPLHQHRIWQRMTPGDGPARLDEVIEQLRAEDDRFHVEGGSWTSDISWVRGYEGVLAPMERASSLFHDELLARGVPSSDPRYRAALFHLLTAETSCFRYWGQGVWTEYGAELARRACALASSEAVGADTT